MAHVPTSIVLDELLGGAPVEQVTVEELIAKLGDRSFGLVLHLLGLLGLLPGVSAIAGVLLIIVACQMILARPGPVLPRRFVTRRFEARRLAKMIGRVTPALRYLERFIHPRWTTPFDATKRVVGSVVLFLGVGLLAPVPLSNVPLALEIVLIALAYLEEDGVLLCVALAAALIMFGIASVVLWETMSATGWVPSLVRGDGI